MSRKWLTFRSDSGVVKVKINKKISNPELNAKIAVEQAICEKLKNQIDLNKSKMAVLLSSRKNIELEMDILKLNITHLAEELSYLEIYNKELEDELTQINSNTLPEIRRANQINGKVIQNLPFIHQTSNNKSSKNKRFFLGKIKGKLINQHFQLESEDPFQIFPEETEVVLKSEYLKELKKVILDSFQCIGDANIIPYISLSVNDMECEYLNNDVIDLTEEDDFETKISNKNLIAIKIDKMESKDNFDDPSLFNERSSIKKKLPLCSLANDLKKYSVFINDQGIPCIDLS